MRRFLLTAANLFLVALSFSLSQKIEVSVQRGHSGAVLTSAVNPENTIAATAGKDKTIKIWELKSGREIRTLTGHEYSVLDLALHPKEKIIASADADGFIKVWDYVSGTLLQSRKIHEDGAISLAFNSKGNWLLSGGRDDQVSMWEWELDKLVLRKKFDGGQRGVKVAFSHDDKEIAVAGDNGFVYVFSREKSEDIDTLRELNYSFCGGCFAEAVFSSDGKKLVTAADRGPLMLWNAGNLQEKFVLEEKVGDFSNIEMSADSKSLLISFEGQIDVYDLEKRQKASSLAKIDKAFTHATLTPDGKNILASTNANKAVIFSRESGEVILSLQGKLNEPIAGDLSLDPNSYWESFPYKIATLKGAFQLSPNGKWAIRGRSGNKIIVWDLENGKPYRILDGHEKAVITCEFSPDGERLISGDAEGTIIYWDIAKGDTLATKRAHYSMVLSFAFSNDGKLLASGGYDGYLNVLDMQTFQVIKRLNFSGTKELVDSPYFLRFTSNDVYIVAGSLGKEFKMLETDTGKEYRNFIGHTEVVSQFLFDGEKMISASWDGAIKAWDYRTGFQEWKISASHLALRAVLQIKEKNWLITAGADREIKIWDTSSRHLTETLKGHTSQVISLSYLKEKNILISSTDNGEVKFWSLDDFQNLTTQYFTGPGDWVVIDANGYFNATSGASDAVVFVNGLESYNPTQFFEQFYNPELTPLLLSSTRSVSDKPALSDMIHKFPLPEVEIIVPKNDQEFQKPTIDVMVKTTNRGNGIDEVRVTHNGKIISRKIDAQSKLQQQGKSMTEVYELELLPGKNIIEASAFNKERLESEKARVVVNYKGKDAVSNCYIVAVGINKYKNSQLNLNYAHSDAENFVEAVSARSGELFQKVEVFELYDQEATRANILAVLDKVAQVAKPSDVIYFFYAGHGSMISDRFYFIPSDNIRLFDKQALEASAISDEQLRDKLKEIRALKQVVIIDACQSGGGAQTIALRGAGNEKALAQLSRSAGVHVMASSGGEQFASEFKELGHGLFTYTLLEALSGEADGAPEDGFITVFELKSYLDAKVPVYSETYKGQPQYPFTFSIGQDFPIFSQPNK